MALGIARRLLSVWHTAARRETLDRELDEELRASIDVLADRYESAGMTGSGGAPRRDRGSRRTGRVRRGSRERP